MHSKDAPVHPDKPESFKLMPHKATYTIKLNPMKKLNDPTINNITGTGTIELVKTKEEQEVSADVTPNIFLFFYFI